MVSQLACLVFSDVLTHNARCGICDEGASVFEAGRHCRSEHQCDRHASEPGRICMSCKKLNDGKYKARLLVLKHMFKDV